MTVTVRWWAGARAAAGVDAEAVAWPAQADCVPTVASALDGVLAHRDPAARERLESVLRACTFLVDGRPARRDRALRPGDTLEVLPPFAGG